MLRLKLLSDLHLEFYDGDAWQDFVAAVDLRDIDVLVLAGDICGASQLARVLTAFCFKANEVVYITGNHEYYGHDFESVHSVLAAMEVANLHWLHNRAVTLCGQRFVGSTLWFPHHPSWRQGTDRLTDFKRIRGFAEQVGQQNEQAVAFLRQTVRPGDVVVTHHLPSIHCAPIRFVSSSLSRYFVSPLDDLIDERRPALWLHGHSHDSADMNFGVTRIVCNPFGYKGYELNEVFDPAMVLQLG